MGELCFGLAALAPLLRRFEREVRARVNIELLVLH